ncbi:hypothetical protein R4P64_07715 [Rhodococcus sp. IEGM 1366]|uniref:hypothetical protein n=1 Tax=Rhodococcus sp. IEGM 1366 TaxID=3082223 RepID=UPI0029556516|nr:hypothetical protein [Rhodococcus sp. IEGM 1366]MDV8066388.1 hypothetical protein [Rhodococcus sp. IEGM 1366]
MAGYVYNPAEFKKFPVEIVENGKTVKYEIPLTSYIPPEITDYADAMIVKRTNEVQKVRDERNEKRQPIVGADPETTYPTNLDALGWMLEMLEPELAEHVSKWPYGARSELWKKWQDESNLSVEKSEASSDSSDATE